MRKTDLMINDLRRRLNRSYSVFSPEEKMHIHLRNDKEKRRKTLSHNRFFFPLSLSRVFSPQMSALFLFFRTHYYYYSSLMNILGLSIHQL